VGLEETGQRAVRRRLLALLSPGDVRIGRRHVQIRLGLDPKGACADAEKRAQSLVDAVWRFEHRGPGRVPDAYLAKLRRNGPLFMGRMSTRIPGAYPSDGAHPGEPDPRIVCVQAFKTGNVRLHFAERADLAAFVELYRLGRLTPEALFPAALMPVVVQPDR
jgi:hypothetical protein